jgi:hypothetical protein
VAKGGTQMLTATNRFYHLEQYFHESIAGPPLELNAVGKPSLFDGLEKRLRGLLDASLETDRPLSPLDAVVGRYIAAIQRAEDLQNCINRFVPSLVSANLRLRTGFGDPSGHTTEKITGVLNRILEIDSEKLTFERPVYFHAADTDRPLPELYRAMEESLSATASSAGRIFRTLLLKLQHVGFVGTFQVFKQALSYSHTTIVVEDEVIRERRERFVDEIRQSPRFRSLSDINRSLFAETTETELLHPTWACLEGDRSPKPRRIERFVSDLSPIVRRMCVVVRGQLMGVRSHDRMIGSESFTVARTERQERHFDPFIALGPVVLCAW